MKRNLLLFTVLFIVIGAHGQIPSDTKLIGGSFGFSQISTSSGNHVSFNISPGFGKAVKDNVVNGIYLSYSYSYDGAGAVSFKEQRAGITFFKQKYLPLGKSPFMAFGEGRLSANYGWSINDRKSYFAEAGIGAGLAFRANNKLMFTLSIPNVLSGSVGYQSQRSSKSFSAGLSSVSSINSLQAGVIITFR